jgi:hypothetical protein
VQVYIWAFNPSLLTRRFSMKKMMLSVIAVICLAGLSSLAFAGEMKGEMKDMKGEMKGEMKGKQDEMKGDMKGKMGEMGK